MSGVSFDDHGVARILDESLPPGFVRVRLSGEEGTFRIVEGFAESPAEAILRAERSARDEAEEWERAEEFDVREVEYGPIRVLGTRRAG